MYRGGGKSAASEHRQQKRILVLMSDTGGGHRASAQAIKAGFEELYGDKYRFDIVDMWTEHTYFPFNGAASTYSFMVKYPILWRLGYTLTQPRIVHVPAQQIMGLLVGRQVSTAYAQYKPDLVVSVHPLMQGVPLRVLKQRIKKGLQDPINFATVVTDLCTCHNTWFSKDVDKCFVATETTAERARSMGLDDRQIVVHGLPIRPAFSRRPPPRPELRRALGLGLDTPAVLVVAGGEGHGPVAKTCAAIAESCGAQVQLVVVCGRNANLAARLNSKKWPEGMQVHVQGFVNNMEQWMHACDVIITKAGPGTIAESFICGLPVLLNGYIPGQEEGNVEYVLEHKVGAFERDPQKMAKYVQSWVTAAANNNGEFQSMVKRARALGTPGSLTRICQDLAALAEHPTFFPGRGNKAPMAMQPS